MTALDAMGSYLQDLAATESGLATAYEAEQRELGVAIAERSR